MNDNKKLRIAFVIVGLLAGGAERVVANLANDLNAKGYDIKIIVMKKAITDYELNEGVKLVGADALSKNGKNHFFKGLGFYIKNIMEYKPDIVVAFLSKTIIISMLCRLFLFTKIPVIACERANPKARRGVLRVLNDFFVKRADGCVFQTKEARDYYNLKENKKTVILKNPISRDFNIQRYEGIRKKEIVAAGRLSEEKNHNLLIEAFAKISNRYPEYKVIIYGEGPLMDELNIKINKLGLKDRVKLPGRVDNIKEKIYDSSLFVLSSDSEGMPNALLEAMALGLPCISTDCPVGGPREIIENYNNGVLVPAGDADKLAEAMDKLLADKELADKIGRNANNIYDAFSEVQVVSEWEEFILKVFSAK